MSDVRQQVIDEFLEVFLDDDQLWAAGGAAEMKTLLNENIDDRGRLNGKVILNYLVTAGVPVSAARGAMDRFVAKRRAALQAGSQKTAAPKASGRAVQRRAPAASPTAATEVARPHARGVGVTKASDVRRPARPSEPATSEASSTLPWGAAPKADDDLATGELTAAHFDQQREPAPGQATQVHDSEATHAANPWVTGENPNSAPPGRAPETSAARKSPPQTPRSASSIRGTATTEISNPGQASPPPAADRTPPPPHRTPPPPHRTPPKGGFAAQREDSAPGLGALPHAESSDPNAATPRRRAATEIRGAPIAASASASPSARSPSAPAAGPPSAFPSGPPSALDGQKKISSPDRKRSRGQVSSEMAEALGVTKRKEDAAGKRKAAAIKDDYTLGLQEHNPEAARGPLHVSVLFSIASASVIVAAAFIFGQPAVKEVTFASAADAFTCTDTRAKKLELFCTVSADALLGDAATLQKRVEASRRAAKEAGYRGVWFFNQDTGRVWNPPLSFGALELAVPAVTTPTQESEDALPTHKPPLPAKENSATDADNVGNIVDALRTAPAKPTVSDDEKPRSKRKRARRKRGKSGKRKRR